MRYCGSPSSVCLSCLGLLLGGGPLDGDLVDVDGDVGLEAGDLLRLGLGQLPLVEPLRQLGVLQVLGAADGHLQPTVEHLEEPETRLRNITSAQEGRRCSREEETCQQNAVSPLGHIN